MSKRGWPAVLLAALVIAGCSDKQPAAPSASRRDAAATAVVPVAGGQSAVTVTGGAATVTAGAAALDQRVAERGTFVFIHAQH